MIEMTGQELRKSFLDFFKSKQHLVLPSAPLIPENDPTLLLIGAGMAPFKPFFTGKLTPPSYRIVTCQKCIRTGDIENVGRTARHHTFFEMLGNFSFGDYFKKESIAWGWEYLTEVLELPADKLWITIYTDDDEAFDIWRNDIGIPEERIVRMEDNFWEIGPGPCGPCSEIYVDLGEERGCGSADCKVGCDCDRYLEIWNHVFTQFNKELDGSYTPLAKKNIDTGAGLERIASVLQNKRSNFETDLLFPIVEFAAGLAGIKYGDAEKSDVSLKVMADHARSITFMVGDGILPSNEGRGYVLRRVLRRAVRHAKLLGIEKMFLTDAVDVVLKIFGGHYTNLVENQDFIKKVMQTEEERFNATLQQGTELLNSQIEELKASGKSVLDGNMGFKLYDTFGFPKELTEEILSENLMTLDDEVFEKAMQDQRERARQARSDKEGFNTEFDFSGCDTAKLSIDENIEETDIVLLFDAKSGKQMLSVSAGDDVAIVLETTPFHAEGGGQVGDIGRIFTPIGVADVYATRKIADGTTVQYAHITEGMLQKGEKVAAKTDHGKKKDTARNHTATHLLHAALKQVLGSHVNQAGSYVGDDRLRFDFSHFSPVTKKELVKIEKIVNDEILQGKAVDIMETSQEKAKEMGATALFGEKYGDVVRVVCVSDFSMELCGGTHVHSLSEIGLFKIIAESSIGAGVRRIEAVTGHEAFNVVQGMDALITEVSGALKCRPDDIASRIEGMQSQVKQLGNEITRLSDNIAKMQSENLEETAKDINGVKAAVLAVDTADIDALRGFGDKMRDKLGAMSVTVLFSKRSDDKLDILVMAGKEALQKGIHAGKLIKEIAAAVGGGGGGRPDMAQAGGKDPAKIPEAMDKAWELIKNQTN